MVGQDQQGAHIVLSHLFQRVVDRLLGSYRQNPILVFALQHESNRVGDSHLTLLTLSSAIELLPDFARGHYSPSRMRSNSGRTGLGSINSEGYFNGHFNWRRPAQKRPGLEPVLVHSINSLFIEVPS